MVDLPSPHHARTKVLSVHRLRRTARQRERELTVSLAHRSNRGERLMLEASGVPQWARGVRVEKAGLLQWAVVATERANR